MWRARVHLCAPRRVEQDCGSAKHKVATAQTSPLHLRRRLNGSLVVHHLRTAQVVGYVGNPLGAYLTADDQTKCWAELSLVEMPVAVFFTLQLHDSLLQLIAVAERAKLPRFYSFVAQVPQFTSSKGASLHLASWRLGGGGVCDM